MKDSWQYSVYRGPQIRGDLSPWKFDRELTTPHWKGDSMRFVGSCEHGKDPSGSTKDGGFS